MSLVEHPAASPAPIMVDAAISTDLFMAFPRMNLQIYSHPNKTTQVILKQQAAEEQQKQRAPGASHARTAKRIFLPKTDFWAKRKDPGWEQSDHAAPRRPGHRWGRSCCRSQRRLRHSRLPPGLKSCRLVCLIRCQEPLANSRRFARTERGRLLLSGGFP